MEVKRGVEVRRGWGESMENADGVSGGRESGEEEEW